MKGREAALRLFPPALQVPAHFTKEHQCQEPWALRRDRGALDEERGEAGPALLGVSIHLSANSGQFLSETGEQFWLLRPTNSPLGFREDFCLSYSHKEQTVYLSLTLSVLLLPFGTRITRAVGTASGRAATGPMQLQVNNPPITIQLTETHPASDALLHEVTNLI